MARAGNDSLSLDCAAVTPSPRKQIAFWALLALLTYLLIEGLAAAGLWALAHWRHLRYEPEPAEALSERHRTVIRALLDGEGGFIALDPEIGWVPKASSAWNRYRIDAAGLRGEGEGPALDPDPARPRIATFGDSFTFGADVPNVYAFQAQMTRLEPDIEVLNFGIPGAGLGQAFMRYRRDGKPYRPQVVTIGFMTENIYRVANTFRPFYFSRTAAPMAKPRFALRRGSLILHPNPLPTPDDYRRLLEAPQETLHRIGRHDYFYNRSVRRSRFDFLPSVRLLTLVRVSRRQPVMVRDRYNTESEPYQVSEKLFDAFYREVESDGATPLILLFPARGDINLHRWGKGKRYQALIDHFETRGYRYVDMLECFAHRAADVDVQELARAHYTPVGNLHVARCLLATLRREGLIPPPGQAPPGVTLAERRAQADAALEALAASPALTDVPPSQRQAILAQARRVWDAKIAALERAESS